MKNWMHSVERHITVRFTWTATTMGTATMRVVFSPPWISAKPNPRRPQIVLERLWHGMFEVNGPHCIYGYRWFGIPDRRDARDLGRLDWADWDHDGSLLFADAGCLFRCSLSDLLSGRAPGLVADLRAQTFTNVRPPPEALLWP